MPQLIIKINVDDKITAYQIVNKIGQQQDVTEASLDSDDYVFDNTIENKSIKYFLREDFDHE